MSKKDLPHPLNICLVTVKFPILGRASDHGFLWPIARGLAKQGHNVTVIAWKNPQNKPEIEQDGVKAFFLGENPRAQLFQFSQLVDKKFNELHTQNPFHIVHSVDNSGIEIGLKKKFYKIAMTYDVEATHMSEIFQLLGYSQENLNSLIRTGFLVSLKFLKTYFGHDRKLLKTADSIIVTSPQQRILLERYYLYPDLKIHSVPYGIEISDLSPRERSEELRKSLNIPANANVIVTVTDMSELGEVVHLLRAFEKLAIKKPASRLILVGDGPLKKEIEYEMLCLALGNKVIFTGQVSSTKLPDYIALADIFVNLSSRTSGFEPSILEAMAQKKLIIGSEVSPIATIVEDGKDGFLIRPADSTTLSQLFVGVFDGKISVTEIGEAARNKVMNLFDTQKMVRMTLDAYYQALINTRHYKRKSLAKLPNLTTQPTT
ncbi:MAG: glycosyltransferase family 4 protein [Bdellovibrionales bacterium]|nr:glycosyltransferase family 4 protein [Bdellovibrionales bacterium]